MGDGWMSESPAQLMWYGGSRKGIWFSGNPCLKRFYITRNTDGYSVLDRESGDIGRVMTFALAKAWAGIRVGERCVRH